MGGSGPTRGIFSAAAEKNKSKEDRGRKKEESQGGREREKRKGLTVAKWFFSG